MKPIRRPNAAAGRAALRRGIALLIAAHGPDAFKREVQALFGTRRGAPKRDDWSLLQPFIETDARDWLAGRDPFQLRRNGTIARAVSRANPDKHVQPKNLVRRFERKLARNRREYMLVTALDLARVELPIEEYFRTLEELAAIGHWDSGDWQLALSIDQARLATYREVYGEPSPSMTWAELEAQPEYPTTRQRADHLRKRR